MADGGGVAVGVDVGGTKLAAGLVTADGEVLDRARVTTPAEDADAVADAIGSVVRRLVAPRDLAEVPVGVGAAGMIGVDGRVRFAPNIDWPGYELRAELQARLGRPVTVENDANAAAWGEYRCGAGAAVSTSLAMVTVGTGVGGGLVLEGALVRGEGFCGEFGHMIVLEGGPTCPCGNRGCLEALASGSAIGATARRHVDEGQAPRGSALYELGDPTGKGVTLAAQAGDEGAVAVLAECGFWLGVGIASLVNALDPAMVVVGGGALQAGELLLEPARASAGERMLGRTHRDPPPIVPAALADDGGLVGAALLALAGE